MIAIVDYGASNLRSVTKALAKLGYQAEITSKPSEVLSAQAVILPGVGAAGDTMQNLKALGLADAIAQLLKERRPFFGICVGLQVLFDATEEGGHECLGILSGQVRRLPPGQKIPHMGWNQVKQKFPHPIFTGIPNEANFYFVHSYYVDPEDKSLIIGETDYGLPICSVVAKGNLIGTQFHPEKSGEVGLKMYKNFLDLAMI